MIRICIRVNLISAEEINFRYDEENLWKENLNLEIRSGDRISIKGSNGSGKRL
jgi:ABC-type bacteriocin/lantibiotic exporter with double-glycine peptidase domain